LSVLRNGPRSFIGRKLGALVTDGIDAGFLRQLETEFNEIGAVVDLVAPAIGGVKAEDGAWIEAKRSLASSPSALFDAVALAVSPQASRDIAAHPLALQFAADAFAHCKFIAFTADARPLLERALNGAALDGGCKQVETAMAAAAFATLCAQLRFWAREPILAL
jgi:catalase